ncbi:MaoC/PaaZ C-terminal domain-containing protein [Bordetella sp. BOR01]|uniref:MaoC/PaaZ C-terminal domain-containing protein n=1 Tax=Bordetella sp. BOR01 TaxID=2854779 RepID=UPI001C470505|nr:MaoC/PaaZ C-terminal domain-containing protein [Bordetella sp. BOR01]MBV7483334.1 MaoC family dehydratase N-terminal domain-containing protein [Bordetella sp. BOR01]
MNESFDAGRLRSWVIPDVVRVYSKQDTMLYALGIGLGADPLSADELQFVYERNLQALPSFPTALAYPFLWYAQPGIGIDLVNVVHAEMGFHNHAPVPIEGKVCGTTRVTAIQDKGARVGALLCTRCEIVDTASGTLVSTLHSASLARANGGFEGTARHAPFQPPFPARQPDKVCDTATLPQAALIYRLSGDPNPLHVEPAVAAKAGFARPILHGRCTFGVAAWALMRLCAGYDPRRLTRMHCRFSSPVFPGEVIRTEVWQDGSEVRFRAIVQERDNIVVLSHGRAQVVD